MPRLTGLSDRDAGLGAKIAYYFTKRRFKQMTGLETATMLEPLRMYAYIPSCSTHMAAWNWRRRGWTFSAPGIVRSQS